MIRRRGIAAALALSTLAPAVQAEEKPQLRYDLALDGGVVLAGGALWITSELLKSSLAPSSCRWCDRNADGSDSLDGVDGSVRKALRASSPDGPEIASSALGFAVLPAFMFGADALLAQRDGRVSEWPVDALVIAEAAVVAADVNQVTKFAFGRERPFVHALAADQKGSTQQPADNNLSFFSGHTTLAFALATATGTVATMRGYKDAPAVWLIGMPIAALTGYLRIAADKHYFTDVVTGALVGSGIGFALPYFFHRPREGAPISVAPMGGAGTTGLRLSGVF